MISAKEAHFITQLHDRRNCDGEMSPLEHRILNACLHGRNYVEEDGLSIDEKQTLLDHGYFVAVLMEDGRDKGYSIRWIGGDS